MPRGRERAGLVCQTRQQLHVVAISEDEPTVAVKAYFRRRAVVLAPSRVRLASDYEAVHFPDETGARKKMNMLYADGHVVAR